MNVYAALSQHEVKCIQPWDGNNKVKCTKKPAWNAALTEGNFYRIIEYSILNTQVKVENDNGKRAWYYPSAFRQKFKGAYNKRLPNDRCQDED